MLKSLFIQNFALIDQLNIEFDTNLNIITGETGAGKSILLGALGLVLGDRLDQTKLKNRKKNTIIEAIFIDAQNTEIIIRRVINLTGKSRIFYNDEPIKLDELKLKTQKLIDIHSQHKNSLLGNASFQLELIDILANTQQDLIIYQDLFLKNKELKQNLTKISNIYQQEQEKEEFYLHQLAKFEQLNLSDDFNNLEAELDQLNNIDHIKTQLYQTEEILGGDNEQDILSLLAQAQQNINKLNNTQKIRENLKQAKILIQETIEDIANLNQTLEPNFERQQELQNTVSVLYELIEVFKVPNITELSAKRQNLEKKIENLKNLQSKIKNLENLINKNKTKLQNLAKILTQKRATIFKKLSQKVIQEIRELGMEKAIFEIKNNIKPTLSIMGQDDINFYFSAHEKNELALIEKVISGGETARIMFVLKNILAQHKALPTIIFDEIDTGISGKVAEKMGEKMQNMAQNTQIITITHLPQIASKKARHLFVYKINDGLNSNIKTLNSNERIQEIANMLSANKITELSLKNAKDLLASG